MKIKKIRSILYGSAKLLGDINAVQKKKVVRRVGVRLVGKLFGRIMGWIF